MDAAAQCTADADLSSHGARQIQTFTVVPTVVPAVADGEASSLGSTPRICQRVMPRRRGRQSDVLESYLGDISGGNGGSESDEDFSNMLQPVAQSVAEPFPQLVAQPVAQSTAQQGLATIVPALINAQVGLPAIIPFQRPVTPNRDISQGQAVDFRRAEQIRRRRLTNKYHRQLRNAQHHLQVLSPSTSLGSYVAQARVDDEGLPQRPNLPVAVKRSQKIARHTRALAAHTANLTRALQPNVIVLNGTPRFIGAVMPNAPRPSIPGQFGPSSLRARPPPLNEEGSGMTPSWLRRRMD